MIHSRHPGGHSGGGRGSRLGRFFEHGDLKLVVLQLIAEKPRHGYEIIKAIEEQAAGAYSPSPGVIYPTLALLDGLGLVSVAESGGGKKLHTATDEGRAYLAANRSTLEGILARMAHVADGRGDSAVRRVRRAMENLKVALRMRLTSDSLTEDQISAITAAIDNAAVAVERV